MGACPVVDRVSGGRVVAGNVGMDCLRHRLDAERRADAGHGIDAWCGAGCSALSGGRRKGALWMEFPHALNPADAVGGRLG